MFVRIFVPLILSVVATAILFVLAAMSDGMCHCMNSMFTLFPYGTTLVMRTSWENTGLLLTFVQFPLYTTLLLVVPGKRWKILVLVLLLMVHAMAAVFALRAHNASRYRYTQTFYPTTGWPRQVGA
jgi:hypothetical protein